MKFNNNPPIHQEENPFFSEFQSTDGRAESRLTIASNVNTFDKEWNLLSPERAAPLTKTTDNSDCADSDEWADAAEIYLLPFHSFADADELNIQLLRQLPAARLDVKWRVLYFDRGAGGAAVYAADLLVLKRRIYEQGDELKDCLEINLDAELPPFAGSREQMKEFKELFGLNATLGAKLTINRIKNTSPVADSPADSSVKSKATSTITGFSRCRDYSTRSQGGKSGDGQTRLRVRLGEYWLAWAKAARRAELDFDYLSALKPSALQPIEMRFYELVQLLRIRGSEKPVSALGNTPLVIGYNEFTELMPLPRMETCEAVEHQMNELCSTHLTRGYLRDISVKSINQKSIFNDAELEICFNK